jgi:catechol 2,3-dioxygenase-like lactoylglutathione lyase family enzyme
MTLDFYVRVLGMPIVHGLRTPSRPAGASHSHGNGAPPHSKVPHYFFDMGGDSLLAFFIPEKNCKVDREAIGAMQHVSFACGPRRYHEILERLKADGITINAGPLLVIPPAIHSFYFFDPNGIRLEITSDLKRCGLHDGGAGRVERASAPSSPKAGTEGSNPAPSTAESSDELRSESWAFTGGLISRLLLVSRSRRSLPGSQPLNGRNLSHLPH